MHASEYLMNVDVEPPSESKANAKSRSLTPRTDAEISTYFPHDDSISIIYLKDHARELERELNEVMREKNRELSEAWHLLNVLSANMMDDGPTWPRVLEWLRRNEKFRPENAQATAPADDKTQTTSTASSRCH